MRLTPSSLRHDHARRLWALLGGFLALTPLKATTIDLVEVFEPITLQGTDIDGAVSDVGEALQACVVSRPMALSGAFPETLADAIRSPHQIPSNNTNYKVREANLLVLCNVGISGELEDSGMVVRIQVAHLAIPTEVDLTSRQVLKLAILALRKTLECYQAGQTEALNVNVCIEGAEGDKSGLQELNCSFSIRGGNPRS